LLTRIRIDLPDLVVGNEPDHGVKTSMGSNYIYVFSTHLGRRIGLTANVIETMLECAVQYPTAVMAEFVAKGGSTAAIPKEFQDFLGSKFDLVPIDNLPDRPSGIWPCTVGEDKFHIVVVAAQGGLDTVVKYAISSIDKLRVQQWLYEYIQKQIGPTPGSPPSPHMPLQGGGYSSPSNVGHHMPGSGSHGGKDGVGSGVNLGEESGPPGGNKSDDDGPDDDSVF